MQDTSHIRHDRFRFVLRILCKGKSSANLLHTNAVNLQHQFSFHDKNGVSRAFFVAFHIFNYKLSVFVVNEIRKVEKDDTEDGEYSRYKMEKALQQACGKYYAPFEERYDFKILYNGKEVKL